MKIKKQELLMYLSNLFSTPLENITVLSERPHVWKHACVKDGVKRLYPINDSYCEMNGIFVELSYCNSCGKLYVYYENVARGV